MDTDISGKQVIFAGEIHGISFIQNYTIKLIKHFQKTSGLRHYLEELDYLTCCSINEYLVSGDERLLQKAFDEVPNAGLFRIREKFEMYRQLYAFNLTLPENERIDVVGLDYNKQAAEAYFRKIRELIPEGAAPDSISKKISALKAPDFGGSAGAANGALKEIQKDLPLHENDYRAFLGSSYSDFIICLYQQITAAEYPDTSIGRKRRAELRENSCYVSLCAILEKYPDDVFFGQWGRNHVRRSSCNGMKWFAALLESKGSPVRGKVLSLYFMVSDCRGLALNDNGELEEVAVDEYRTHLAAITGIADAMNSNITAFRLSGDDSPFEKSLHIVDPEASGGGATTDYIDYVFLFQNSPPSAPL